MQQQSASDPEYSQIVLWLDFYSQLLTPRTREVLELHYNEDMSLSEIAEHLSISRQGVHDKIKQGLVHLAEYEQLLGLSTRYVAQKKQIENALIALDASEPQIARDILSQLHETL
ncbi:MAG: sigma factor-like helix-turn-helix DNA-binding protein [Eubacteriales bacterium]|nr:sigma factor-like helix-turn-helix DNA-binding protein [Eubacteriales bacterium]